MEHRLQVAFKLQVARIRSRTQNSHRPKKMQTITTEQLHTWQANSQDYLLVNTLDPEHFEKTKIPNAINIPVSRQDFVDKVLFAAGSKQRLVVVYCASHDCQSSTKAAKRLSEAGFNVADYEGGAAAWNEQSPPTTPTTLFVKENKSDDLISVSRIDQLANPLEAEILGRRQADLIVDLIRSFASIQARLPLVLARVRDTVRQGPGFLKYR